MNFGKLYKLMTYTTPAAQVPDEPRGAVSPAPAAVRRDCAGAPRLSV